MKVKKNFGRARGKSGNFVHQDSFLRIFLVSVSKKQNIVVELRCFLKKSLPEEQCSELSHTFPLTFLENLRNILSNLYPSCDLSQRFLKL